MNASTATDDRAAQDKKLLSAARFRFHDVVVTERTVKPVNPRGKKEGGAAPGWLWRIVKVYVDYIGTGKDRAVYYDCVAQTAPGYYRITLRDHQISRRVGRHNG